MKFRLSKTIEPSLRQRRYSLNATPPTYSYRSLPRADQGESQPLSRRHSTERSKSQLFARAALWRFWSQRLGFVAGTLTLVICAVVLLQLSSNPKVIVLDHASSSLQNPVVYQQAAAHLFASSYANRNKITVNTEAIAHKLAAQFPELQSVSIALPLLGHRPLVYLEAAPLALIVTEQNGQSFVVNTSGHAVLSAQQDGAAAGLPVVNDQSGLQARLGDVVLPSHNVQFIQTVVYELQHAHITMGSMTLPGAASELDVVVRGQPFIIKFNLQSGTAQQQAGTFLAVWQQLQRQHVTPKHYIDVRIDGRAYYK